MQKDTSLGAIPPLDVLAASGLASSQATAVRAEVWLLAINQGGTTWDEVPAVNHPPMSRNT